MRAFEWDARQRWGSRTSPSLVTSCLRPGDLTGDGDCFGYIRFKREVAIATGQRFLVSAARRACERGQSVVDVTVSVPRERLGEFYALLGRFFGSEESAEDATRISSEAPARQVASAPAVGRVTGRYAPLYEHLLRAQGDQLEMSFGEVKRVLGRELPPSSRKYREYWANSVGNHFGQSWLRAGWRVAAVDLRMERVRFERG